MKANDNWNPADVPSSRPAADQYDRSSMQLIGSWPSTLGVVASAGFSPGSHSYWTGGIADAMIRVYDTESGTFLHEFRTGQYPNFSARILSDEMTLCSLDQEARFRNSDLVTKILRFEHDLGIDFIDSTDISPDGRHAIVCYSQRPAVCFRIEPDKTEPAWMACLSDGNAVTLTEAVFSSDGKLIVGRTVDGFLGIWHTKDGTFDKKMLADVSPLKPVRLSSDNSKLLCLDWERQQIVLLDIVTGSHHLHLQLDSFVEVTTISPNGRWITSGDREGRLALWDVNTGNKYINFLESGKEVRCLAFSPDNRFLLSGGEDGLSRLWDVETGKEIRSHEGHMRDIFWQALSRDGHYHAYHDNTEVRVIDLETQTLLSKIKAGAAWDLSFTDDLRAIHFEDFTKKTSRVIEYWNLEGIFLYDTLKPDTEEGLENSRRSYSFDKEYYLKREKTIRKRILGVPVSAGSTSVDVYRAKDDCIVQQFTLPFECEHGSQWFSSDGKRVILSEPHGYHVGNRETGQWELFLDHENGKGIMHMDISPDGSLLAIGLYDGTVRLWHMAEHRWIRSFEGHPGPIEGLGAANGVTFSKDGTRLMTTDLDYTFV